ncbi:MAG: hypothetical protein HYY40_01735 [Bacteroidetes bacterium]|nr:hypothetical protein [Bacteroidota bacterium]
MYINSTIIFVFLLCCNTTWSLFGQQFQFNVLQHGTSFKDSSYYDILNMDDNKYWAIGEYGIITEIDQSGNLKNISYPNKGVDLYDAIQLTGNRYIFSCDAGNLLFYDRDDNTWEYITFPGYKKYCFYKIARISDTVAVVCGGKSVMTEKKKRIPFGFMLMTTDGGKTWKSIYKDILKMVWCVKYDTISRQINAMLYTPGSTRLIASAVDDIQWKTVKKTSGLYHDFESANGNFILSGSKNSKFLENGSVLINTLERIFDFSTGFLWDVETSGQSLMGCGSNGYLVYINENKTPVTLKTPVDNNLYKVFYLSENSALIAGNGKTLLGVAWKTDNE